MPPKKIIVIGSGFAGLSASANLAKMGYDVSILEKNKEVGGRARMFKSNGFTFDMGPSWYWMPEIFESFFSDFNHYTTDFYDLVRLDPSYQIIFKGNHMEIPAGEQDLYDLFEREEPGSSLKLEKFLQEAEFKYKTGMHDFVNKPAHSALEFAEPALLKSMFKIQLFSSLSNEVRRLFKSEKLIQLLEFPVLFLGAMPQKTPALYSLMNYADLKLGTWYPMGGMHKIVEAMQAVAQQQGVKIITNCPVLKIVTKNRNATGVETPTGFLDADVVVATADYHFVEQQLLQKEDRQYSPAYWDKRTMAPSSLLFYIGLNKKIKGIKHHNLFFDADFGQHASDIYVDPKWPNDPLFYACVPSVTDPTVAPQGQENLFLLIPLAAGMKDRPDLHEQYLEQVVRRMEKYFSQSIFDHIIYKRSYCIDDFKKDYNAFKGNAYGLANTLLQTAFLKPKMRSKKIPNLFYAGQLTTPGPGVPPSIISGQVAAREIHKYYPNNSL